MSDSILQIIVGLVLAGLTGLASILYADQRAKGRLDGHLEKQTDNTKRLDSIEEQERSNIGEHAALKTTVSWLATQIDRIDDQKASKEVVDGFRREVSELKFDMDKRFDKLERLITRLAGKQDDGEG
jgi:hypothetical protein